MGESAVSVTRLRSEKGSFVQSPLNAFETAGAGGAPRGTIVNIIVRPNSIYVVRDPPNCSIQLDNSLPPEPDNGVTQYIVEWDDPIPTALEQVTNKWVGLLGTGVLDPTNTAVVCGAGVYGDEVKFTNSGGKAYKNIVLPGSVSGGVNPTASYYYNWGFYLQPEEPFSIGQSIALESP